MELTKLFLLLKFKDSLRLSFFDIVNCLLAVFCSLGGLLSKFSIVLLKYQQGLNKNTFLQLIFPTCNRFKCQP